MLAYLHMDRYALGRMQTSERTQVFQHQLVLCDFMPQQRCTFVSNIYSSINNVVKDWKRGKFWQDMHKNYLMKILVLLSSNATKLRKYIVINMVYFRVCQIEPYLQFLKGERNEGVSTYSSRSLYLRNIGNVSHKKYKDHNL